MASSTVNSGKDQDLTFDDVKLDDLTLDDDALFADLDNEVRLEGAGAGEDGLSLDLKDDAVKLDFDVEAVGAPAEAAPAKAASGKSAPSKAAPSQAAPAGAPPAQAGSSRGAVSAGDLELDDLKAGSMDDLDLEVSDAELGAGDAAGMGDFDLDLDMSATTRQGAGGDLDQDLTGAAGAGQKSGDVLDLNLDLEEAPAAGPGTGRGAADDLDLSLDMGSAAGKDTAAVAGTGEPAAETGRAEIDLNLEPTRSEERSRSKGAEQLDEVVIAEDRGEGSRFAGAEAVLDTEELPAAGAEEAPQEFHAVPDVDLAAVDLNLDMPPSESHGDEATRMAEPEAAAASTSIPAFESAGRFAGMGGSGSEEVVELNLSDLESQSMGFGEQLAPGATAQRRMPLGAAAAGRPPAAVPAGAAEIAPAGRALTESVLLSLPHQVQVRMGSVSLQGQDILNLDYGSVVPLNRSVGEPVELTLNGKTIAQGEIVVINGRNLGVRIVALET